MSGFNGSGTFNISGVGLPYTSGTTISSSVANQLNTDLATGLSTCITKDGQSTITANIGWNNFNINNLSALGIGTAAPLGKMEVKSGSTTNFIIDSSGNIGIGTSSPTYKLQAYQSTANTDVIALQVSSSTSASFLSCRIGSTGSGTEYGNLGSDGTNFLFRAANAAGFYTSGSERMRIDSVGNLLINITSPGYQNKNCQSLEGDNGYGVFSHASGTSSGTLYIAFGYAGVGIGSITQNGTTQVSYNTSSDYRLKENVQPMVNALDRVAQFKPVTYQWKSDGSDGEGFIAHELAEVCPLAVSGKKDAIDEDGKIIPQGIDPSKIVAVLTAAIQELKAELDTVKTELAALKGS